MSTLSKITSACVVLLLCMLCVPSQAQAADAKGERVADALKKAKSLYAPDGRTAVWDLEWDESSQSIKGKVSHESLLAQLKDEMGRSGLGSLKYSVKVLESSVPAEKRWAIVKLSVASLRCDGKHSAEMATQAVMGTPVKVIELVGEWCRVQTPDNYISYAPESSLQFVTDAQFDAWRTSRRYIVTVYGTRLLAAAQADETVSDLVLGNVLQWRGENDKWVQLATPDGRVGYVEKSQVAPLDVWAQQAYDDALLERTCRRMLGSGYLWGGTSTKVTDCSGLMKIAYLANGIILSRDASQQALTGEKIADWHKAELGDLLFFGNSKTGRVTHVGMYLRDGLYIHCSGQVKINSLEEKSPLYLYSPLSISRIKTKIGTTGIIPVRDHSWFFAR